LKFNVLAQYIVYPCDLNYCSLEYLYFVDMSKYKLKLEWLSNFPALYKTSKSVGNPPERRITINEKLSRNQVKK